MMNKNTSYKRIVSLVLAVVMFAAMLTVSAAENTMIYVNDQLAENGAKYDSAVTVTVKGDFAKVTVNGEEVALDKNNSFVIDPAAAETEDVATTDTATTDTATADTATTDTAAPTVKAEGAVNIAVYDAAGNVLSAVSITIEPATETDDEPVNTGDEPVNTGDEPVNTGDEPVNTGDEPVNTGDEPVNTGDEPVNTGDEPVNTGDEPVNTGDEPVNTGDEPVNTDDQPINTDDQPINTDDQPINTDDQPINTDDQPKTEKYLNGDVDFDKAITSGDAVLILRFSNEQEEFNDVQKAVADVTGNGVFSDDALVVLRASVGLDTINPEYVDVVVK